jgi:hypothetical protein
LIKICRVTGTTHIFSLLCVLPKYLKVANFAFRWGDITQHIDSDGSRYLELNERQTKTRTEENISMTNLSIAGSFYYFQNSEITLFTPQQY